MNKQPTYDELVADNVALARQVNDMTRLIRTLLSQTPPARGRWITDIELQLYGLRCALDALDRSQPVQELMTKYRIVIAFAITCGVIAERDLVLARALAGKTLGELNWVFEALERAYKRATRTGQHPRGADFPAAFIQHYDRLRDALLRLDDAENGDDGRMLHSIASTEEETEALFKEIERASGPANPLAILHAVWAASKDAVQAAGKQKRKARLQWTYEQLQQAGYAEVTDILSGERKRVGRDEDLFRWLDDLKRTYGAVTSQLAMQASRRAAVNQQRTNTMFLQNRAGRSPEKRH